MLNARSLRFAYEDGYQAVDGIDLELRTGELVCVLGPNGSGKSTLLKLLGGTLEPDAGSIELFGRPLGRIRDRERARHIASVPQALVALPNVAVEDFVLGGRYPHLSFFGRPRPRDGEAVTAALDEAHASAFRRRSLRELSGGQAQRVLVARALAQEAELLLFDEPTAALDPGHQVLLFELFSRLVANGRAALIATHELNLASRFARRVVLLHEGRVRAHGPVDEVFRPEVLTPVYGPDLWFGSTGGTAARPLVLPWPSEAAPGGDPPAAPR